MGLVGVCVRRLKGRWCGCVKWMRVVEEEACACGEDKGTHKANFDGLEAIGVAGKEGVVESFNGAGHGGKAVGDGVGKTSHPGVRREPVDGVEVAGQQGKIKAAVGWNEPASEGAGLMGDARFFFFGFVFVAFEGDQGVNFGEESLGSRVGAAEEAFGEDDPLAVVVEVLQIGSQVKRFICGEGGADLQAAASIKHSAEVIGQVVDCLGEEGEAPLGKEVWGKLLAVGAGIAADVADIITDQRWWARRHSGLELWPGCGRGFAAFAGVGESRERRPGQRVEHRTLLQEMGQGDRHDNTSSKGGKPSNIKRRKALQQESYERETIRDRPG